MLGCRHLSDLFYLVCLYLKVCKFVSFFAYDSSPLFCYLLLEFSVLHTQSCLHLGPLVHLVSVSACDQLTNYLAIGIHVVLSQFIH